jgi:hypothetical protein
MATYKTRLFDELEKLADKYPNAKVADMVWALQTMTGAIWRSRPRGMDNPRLAERTKSYRVA